ncbi:MAG: zinc transporter ZupT [Nitrospira defluvii]|nr:zinc transporter ZupT [Nitrospira defluvii]
MLKLLALGSVAGLLPVYLGIAVASLALTALNQAWGRFLTGLSVGILLYLFFDVIHEAMELTGVRDILSWTILLGSLLVSFVGLAAIEERRRQTNTSDTTPLFLPFMIALGMGLHNLGEGLAIGASYAQGQWALSSLLVGGFALHNGTEGFGIMGAVGRTPLSVKDIVLLGLLAGGPTCFGTMISGYGVSPYLSITFYTLAAGSLLYVIVSLVALSYTGEHRLHTAMGIFVGIGLMYTTGMILSLLIGANA